MSTKKPMGFAGLADLAIDTSSFGKEVESDSGSDFVVKALNPIRVASPVVHSSSHKNQGDNLSIPSNFSPVASSLSEAKADTFDELREICSRHGVSLTLHKTRFDLKYIIVHSGQRYEFSDFQWARQWVSSYVHPLSSNPRNDGAVASITQLSTALAEVEPEKHQPELPTEPVDWERALLQRCEDALLREGFNLQTDFSGNFVIRGRDNGKIKIGDRASLNAYLAKTLPYG